MGESRQDRGIGSLHSDPAHRLRVFCDYSMNTDGYRFFFGLCRLADEDAPSKRLTVDGFSVRETEPGEITDPAFVLTEIEAQELMNSLWNAGVRPGDVGGPGELSALRGHLADMRAIVAKTVEVDLPG